jgi:hypothetical protein
MFKTLKAIILVTCLAGCLTSGSAQAISIPKEQIVSGIQAALLAPFAYVFCKGTIDAYKNSKNASLICAAEITLAGVGSLTFSAIVAGLAFHACTGKWILPVEEVSVFGIKNY